MAYEVTTMKSVLWLLLSQGEHCQAGQLCCLVAYRVCTSAKGEILLPELFLLGRRHFFSQKDSVLFYFLLVGYRRRRLFLGTLRDRTTTCT